MSAIDENLDFYGSKPNKYTELLRVSGLKFKDHLDFEDLDADDEMIKVVRFKSKSISLFLEIFNKYNFVTRPLGVEGSIRFTKNTSEEGEVRIECEKPQHKDRLDPTLNSDILKSLIQKFIEILDVIHGVNFDRLEEVYTIGFNLSDPEVINISFIEKILEKAIESGNTNRSFTYNGVTIEYTLNPAENYFGPQIKFSKPLGDIIADKSYIGLLLFFVLNDIFNSLDDNQSSGEFNEVIDLNKEPLVESEDTRKNESVRQTTLGEEVLGGDTSSADQVIRPAIRDTSSQHESLSEFAEDLPNVRPEVIERTTDIPLSNPEYILNGNEWTLKFSLSRSYVESIRQLKILLTDSGTIEELKFDIFTYNDGGANVVIKGLVNRNVLQTLSATISYLNRQLIHNRYNFRLTIPESHMEGDEAKVDRRAENLFKNYKRLMQLLGDIYSEDEELKKRKEKRKAFWKSKERQDSTPVAKRNIVLEEFARLYNQNNNQYVEANDETHGYAYDLISNKVRGNNELVRLIRSRLNAISVLYSGSFNDEFMDIASSGMQYLEMILLDTPEEFRLYKFLEDITPRDLSSVDNLLSYLRNVSLDSEEIDEEMKETLQKRDYEDFRVALFSGIDNPEDLNPLNYSIPAGSILINPEVINNKFGSNAPRIKEKFKVSPEGHVPALYEAYTTNSRELINSVYGGPSKDPIAIGLTKVIGYLDARGVLEMINNLLRNKKLSEDELFIEIQKFVQGYILKSGNNGVITLFNSILVNNSTPNTVANADVDKYRILIVSRLIFEAVLYRLGKDTLIKETRKTNIFLDEQLINVLPENLRKIVYSKVKETKKQLDPNLLDLEDRDLFKTEAEVRLWIIELTNRMCTDIINLIPIYTGRINYEPLRSKYLNIFNLRLRGLSLKNGDVRAYLDRFKEVFNPVLENIKSTYQSGISVDEKKNLSLRLLREGLMPIQRELHVINLIVPETLNLDVAKLEEPKPEILKPKDYKQVLGRDTRSGFQITDVAFSEGSDRLDVVRELADIGKINEEYIPKIKDDLATIRDKYKDLRKGKKVLRMNSQIDIDKLELKVGADLKLLQELIENFRNSFSGGSKASKDQLDTFYREYKEIINRIRKNIANQAQLLMIATQERLKVEPKFDAGIGTWVSNKFKEKVLRKSQDSSILDVLDSIRKRNVA